VWDSATQVRRNPASQDLCYGDQYACNRNCHLFAYLSLLNGYDMNAVESRIVEAD